MNNLNEIEDKLIMFDYGLDSYGMDFEKLLSLSDRIIEVSVEIQYWPEKEYFKYHPQIRSKKRKEWYKNAYERILQEWPTSHTKKISSNRLPVGFISEIKISDLIKVIEITDIAQIRIIKVPGLRKKKLKEKRVKKFFTVKARFVVQIEGVTQGLQRYEERLILLKAYDFEDAEQKALRGFKEYEDTYLVKNGSVMVRWKFEEILYIYDVSEEEIDPDGTEVFSEFKFRRMKPEYEWHPDYQDDEQKI